MEAVLFLFFGMVILVIMALPVAALVVAIVAYSRIGRLEQRVAELSAALAAARKERLFRARTPEPDPVREPEPKAIPEPRPEPQPVPAHGPEPAPEATPEPRPVAKEVSPHPLPSSPEKREEPRRGARPRVSLESIGVWAASALGGFILLVAGFLAFKLAIDRGWLGPEVRFAGGLGFGLMCMIAAELLWSKDYRLPAAGLGGAGVGILYAALYAGHAWYDLLGVTPTFALMALVTAVGVGWAVKRNSQFVAVLGMLGGYLTPVLLSTGENKALALFTYIGLLLMGLLTAAVRRGWWTLILLAGPATAAVLLGWGLKFLGADQAPTAFAASLVLGSLLWIVAWWAKSPRPVAWAAAGGAVLVHLAALPYLLPLELSEGLDPAAVSALLTTGHPWMAVGFLLVVAAGLQALATRKGWAVLGVVGALSLLPGLVTLGLGWLQGVKPEPEWGDFGAFQRGLGGLYGLDAMPPLMLPLALLGTVLVVWLASRMVTALPGDEPTLGGKPLPLRSAHGAVAAVLVAGLALLVISAELDSVGTVVALCAGLAVLGWLVAARPGPSWIPIAVLGLLASALMVNMLDETTGLLAAGAAVVVIYLGAPFLLDSSAHTRSLTSSPLPWLASVAAGPLLFLPMHAGWEQSLGTDAIGLLPLALGVGTLAATVVLRERLRQIGGRTRSAYVAVALLFACLAVPVQLNNEWWTVGWALEGAALAWMSRRMRHPGVVGLSLVLLLTVTVRLVLNPEVLGYHPQVEGSLINWTLYGYGMPALSLLAAAWWLRPMGEDDRRMVGPWSWLRFGNPTAVLMAVMVTFMLINLEVSAAFPEGDRLHLWSTTLEASMTRSISWAVFGLLLLLPGQRHDLRYLRPVALLLLMMAALKVFLLDLWQLSGIVRVGSLFGVAVTLILAALAFQRLVLKDHRQRQDPEEPS